MKFKPWLTSIGYVLAFFTLPALLENAWEVYIGTLLSGPQMIGFVLAHADQDSAFVRVIRYSSLVSVLFSIYALFVLSRIISGCASDRHQRFFAWCFVALCAHNIIASLYGYWSPLFSKGA